MHGGMPSMACASFLSVIVISMRLPGSESIFTADVCVIIKALE